MFELFEANLSITNSLQQEKEKLLWYANDIERETVEMEDRMI